jgi:ubiquinone/menaquinone biosynthesis C-methylase UbiE
MLGVAKRKGPHIDWREASADAIPFEDSTFDAVVSQFGLMFFPDKPLAIQEMLRVLRPGGSLAIAVWDSLENNAGYAAISLLLSRLFGDSAAESLTAPYSLGVVPELSSLFVDAGASNTKITTIEGKACFPSIRHWMEADIRGWTLADSIDDAEFERLVSEAEAELAHLVTEDGRVEFGNPAHIVTATRHAG